MNNIIYFMLLLFSFCILQQGNASSIKYGHGNSNGFEIGKIHRLSDDETIFNYKISENENKNQQLKYNIQVALLIKQEDSHLLASVLFNNKSRGSYFVHRNRLTLDNNGADIDATSEMCGESFLITTGNIALDYSGHKCEFDESSFEYDWVEIKPSKGVIFNFDLGKHYNFLPKNNSYNIGSLEYYVADEKWFTVKKIYKYFFRIMNIRYEACDSTSKEVLCKFNPQPEDTIKYFLETFYINGGREGEYFKIRTNQMKMNVDGDHIKVE